MTPTTHLEGCPKLGQFFDLPWAKLGVGVHTAVHFAAHGLAVEESREGQTAGARGGVAVTGGSAMIIVRCVSRLSSAFHVGARRRE